MPRYADKITHTCSTNPNRPIVQETFQMARVTYISNKLEKLPLEEQIYIIETLKKEGLLI